MAEGIFDVVAEDPKIKHITEEMEESPMEKHGGKEGEINGNPGGSIKRLPRNDLVRNRPPLEDESLAFDDIQRNLMKKNPSIGQNDPDGDEGKSEGWVVVFQGDKQILVPLGMFWSFV